MRSASNVFILPSSAASLVAPDVEGVAVAVGDNIAVVACEVITVATGGDNIVAAGLAGEPAGANGSSSESID